MSNSSYSDTENDSTDGESSSEESKQTSTSENPDNKQEKTPQNNKKESLSEGSSDSETSQNSKEKSESDNQKQEQSESSEEDTDEPSVEEELKEPMDVSSSTTKGEKKDRQKSKSSSALKKESSEPRAQIETTNQKESLKDKKSTEQKKSTEETESTDQDESTEEKIDKKRPSTETPKTREAPVDQTPDDNNDASPPNSKSGTEDNRKMDRYGWYVDKKKISKQEQQLIQIENQKESERTQKWLDMTKNWSSFMKKNRNKVAERVKKGIPDQMRSRAWALLCQAEKMKKQYPMPMSELLKRPRHQGYTTIDKDLVRTFPQIGFFSKSGFIESLRRILYCYCQTDPVLGYTQGMSFIAGMFLSYMDEETAFYSFLNVMLGKRLNQRGYFLAGFPRLDKANLMLGCLMEKKCPKVLKKMDSLGIMMSMFTPGWFLTVFQSYTWLPEFQLRIFERYLFYGTRGLLNFGIVIILYHQKILEKADMEEFLKILQHPDSSEKMLNWHSVLQDWDKNWLNKAEYEKLLTRCGVQKETESY